MSLTALPAFTDDDLWMIDDCVRASVVDPGEPVAEALDARRLELAAILMTRRCADRVDAVDSLRSHQRRVFEPGTERVAQGCIDREEGHTADALGLVVGTFDIATLTAGHIAYVDRFAAGESIACCGDTLFPAGRADGAAGGNGSDLLAALRTWKSEFR